MPSANKTSSSLQQGRLSFAASKRTTSASGAKGSLKSSSKGTATLSQVTIGKRGHDAEEVVVDALDSHSDSGVDQLESPVTKSTAEDEQISPPTKRRRTASHTSASATRTPSVKTAQSSPEKTTPVPESVKRAKLSVSDKKYNKHYSIVREKMGNIQPIHDQGKNRIHHILRVFDLSDEYGPCIGVTRIERWERADAFGLGPPPEVRDILLTQEGVDKDEYARDVFYGEV